MVQKLKIFLYNSLINRNTAIKYQYLKIEHNNTIFSYFCVFIYVLWLNFNVYVLRSRSRIQDPRLNIYEEKKLLLKISESEAASRKSIDDMVNQLKTYDVISFDIFDTLILRTFDNPTLIFQYIGYELNYLNFEEIRIEAEIKARNLMYQSEKTNEVSLEDIYHILEHDVGIDSKLGIELEKKYELMFTVSNPYFKEIYNQLIELDKHIIATSDMYLDLDTIKAILLQAGYDQVKQIYLSSELKISKSDGKMYEYLNQKYRKNKTLIHVGDNYHSDYKQAKSQNVDAIHYNNVNQLGEKYRAKDMSRIIGSAYRGIINNQLYNGLHSYSKEYEYGFIYGGLLVLGYCNYIQSQVNSSKIDRILFLSRDGDIISQAYNMLYPMNHSKYALWSRGVGTRLTSNYYKKDYMDKFVRHKVSKGIKIKDILIAMDLSNLIENLEESNINKDACLDKKNMSQIVDFLENRWDEIQKQYSEEAKLAISYYSELIGGASNIGIVDIGWAGSGVTTLRYLIKKNINKDINVTGFVVGTNTPHNLEEHCSEIFMQTKSVKSYVYSQSKNRDILKKHNLYKGYNLYLELLFGSNKRSFKKFIKDDETQEIAFEYAEAEKNSDKILDIQAGILDFIKIYIESYKEQEYMMQINGRDAYAPFLLASSHNESYLKNIYKNFNLEADIT